MTKTYKTLQLVRALESKGFRESSRGDKFLEFWHEDRKIISTFVSHGRRECGPSLLGLMARECQLSGRDFRDLIDCPMSQEAYVSRLRELDVI